MLPGEIQSANYQRVPSETVALPNLKRMVIVQHASPSALQETIRSPLSRVSNGLDYVVSGSRPWDGISQTEQQSKGVNKEGAWSHSAWSFFPLLNNSTSITGFSHVLPTIHVTF